MQYVIIFNPELNIDSKRFETHWNKSSYAHDIGLAYMSETDSIAYDPTFMTGVLIGVAAGVATNLLSEALLGLLKTRFDQDKPLDITYIELSDGNTEVTIALKSQSKKETEM